MQRIVKYNFQKVTVIKYRFKQFEITQFFLFKINSNKKKCKNVVVQYYHLFKKINNENLEFEKCIDYFQINFF